MNLSIISFVIWKYNHNCSKQCVVTEKPSVSKLYVQSRFQVLSIDKAVLLNSSEDEPHDWLSPPLSSNVPNITKAVALAIFKILKLSNK